MKILRSWPVLSAMFLALVSLFPAAAEEAPEVGPEKSGMGWQNDSLGQFVFFAVLEGLYRDGVQDAVVDAVLATDVDQLDTKVKHCFVFKCELCHAVYEAFSLYRARPHFANAEGRTSFGKGVDLKILNDLNGEEPRLRVFAMGSLVRPWIQHRVDATRMTEVEKAAMKKQFEEYAKKGAELLSKYKREPGSVYVDWNFYGSCQACEASRDFE